MGLNIVKSGAVCSPPAQLGIITSAGLLSTPGIKAPSYLVGARDALWYKAYFKWLCRAIISPILAQDMA